MRKHLILPIVGVVLLALLIIGLRAAGLFWPFRLVFDQIGNPVGTQLIRAKNYAGDQLTFVTSINNLNKDNKQLEHENLDLKRQLSALKEVGRENELLRSQLKFNARLNLELVPARVVSIEPDDSRRFITIDRGSSSGLLKGQAVVSSGVLVGTIDEVNDYSAKVFLVSDPDFRIRAIGQDGRAQGVIRGEIGQGYAFEKIAQSESVSPGELIVTAGSGQVPQGVLIGSVEAVNRADNAIFQSANVKSLVDLNSLELVFVVTGLKQ